MRKVLELKVVKVGKDETFSAWNDNQSYLLLGNCAKNQLATQDDDYKVHCLTSNDSERTVNGPIGSESSRNLPVNVPLHTQFFRRTRKTNTHSTRCMVPVSKDTHKDLCHDIPKEIINNALKQMSKAVQSRNIGPKRRNLKSAINNRSPLLDQWKTQGRTAQERSSLPRRIMTSEGERLKSVRETTVSNEIREVLIDFSRKNSKSPSAKANKPWLSMNRLQKEEIMKQLNLEPIFTSINLFKFDKFYEKCVRKIARIQSGQGDKPKSENKYRKLKIQNDMLAIQISQMRRSSLFRKETAQNQNLMGVVGNVKEIKQPCEFKVKTHHRTCRVKTSCTPRREGVTSKKLSAADGVGVRPWDHQMDFDAIQY